MIQTIIKNVKAYPVLRKRFMNYMKGVQTMPKGFSREKLFNDYLKVRRKNPEKRVSMSEYMIFGFYRLTTEQQKEFLTDTEATLLMRPYNIDSVSVLKDKVRFLKTFAPFIKRDWLYLPEATFEEFHDFMQRHENVALKPPLSSWGIGFRKLNRKNIEDEEALFAELAGKGYLAEEFLKSDDALAKFHPASLNTLRIITFRDGDRFHVFGGGLRVGNNGKFVDNAHGGGIFCEIDVNTGEIITDGLDEFGNVYITHPVTGEAFRGQQIPLWQDCVDFCRTLTMQLDCLHVVGWDIAILPGGKIEVIEGNHNPGMNIIQAAAKHGVRRRFEQTLLDFYGPADAFTAARQARIEAEKQAKQH